MKVAIIGLGYVGGVYAAGLASLGHDVIGFDIDATKVKQYQSGQTPFFEPGFSELLNQAREERRLEISHDLAETVRQSEVLLLCVGTPMAADRSVDTSAIERTAEMISNALKMLEVSGDSQIRIIANKSTVPVGTCDLIALAVGNRAIVVSNPEFTQEGLAVYGFHHPPQIVVGLPDNPNQSLAAKAKMTQLYAALNTPVTWCDIRTAEMIKLAINSMLATTITLANCYAEFCERVGADYTAVAAAMKRDSRIGPRAFINAGPGYGGSCFPKDTAGLLAAAKEKNLLLAALLDQVIEINHYQIERVIARLLSRFAGSIKDQQVTIWGMAFKTGTDDLRNSPGVALAKELLRLGATVHWYDPAVKQVPELAANKRFVRFPRPVPAALESGAILITTELTTVRSLDYQEIKNIMIEPRIIFDTRNILDADFIRSYGFEYLGSGR